VRTLIAGGGTGGHLTPALAVAQTLRRTDPAGEVMLAGRRGGLEERMVPAAGLPLVTLAVRGVDTSRPLSAALALARLLPAVMAARRILRDFAADVVVGAAGYVCVPVVLAARSLRIPVVLMEQNAVPGRAVRLLAGGARAVAASFAETGERLPRARVVHTGNPVREEVLAWVPAPVREACEHLLVMGGSQGAQRINQALGGCLVALLEANPRLRVTHQCGARHAEWAEQLVASLSAPLRARYTVSAFFDDLAERIRDADLVVMRAGGSSLAEVSVLGRPMLLVPYPHARAHQVDNAVPYVRCGAARMLRDEECDAGRLRAEVEAIATDPVRWRAMARASAAAGRPDAARRVAELLAEVAAGGRLSSASPSSADDGLGEAPLRPRQRPEGPQR
jgi:UDP-N-acetylglucosamine--N-acetylmuramyl-(pentapeptide) pyrophosphoryl-undecaprenol N-acetylglucosamine transferase